MGEPFTYELEIDRVVFAPVLENGAGLFGLPTAHLTQHSRLARALIIMDGDMQVFGVGQGSQAVQ